MRFVLSLMMLCMALGTVDVAPGVEMRSCPPTDLGPICRDYWTSDIIFTGTVTKIVNVPYTEPMSEWHWQRYQKVTATVRVDEVFRGSVGREVTFEMGDCYFEFEEGRKYIIYPFKGQNGKFYLSRGRTRTRPIEEAGEDLDYIRGLANERPGSRLFGEVWDYRERPTLRVSVEPSSAAAKLPGVRIFLQQGENRFETISNAEGGYEFIGLPEGKYEMTTDLPEHLSGTRETIPVTGKGCVPMRLGIQATGEIKGRLVDADGQPLTGAVVSIFAAEGVTEEMLGRVRQWSMTRSETDKDGAFSFVRLPSGRYHLAVNLLDAERKQGSRAERFPRMFYPGVSSFSDAKPVLLGDGEKLLNVEMRLLTIPSEGKPRLTMLGTHSSMMIFLQQD